MLRARFEISIAERREFVYHTMPTSEGVWRPSTEASALRPAIPPTGHLHAKCRHRRTPRCFDGDEPLRLVFTRHLLVYQFICRRAASMMPRAIDAHVATLHFAADDTVFDALPCRFR